MYLYLKENYIYIILFISILLLLVLFNLNRPFIDHDTVIYTIIGRDIFENFTMPYGNTFDHKPIFTYYLYGILNLIFHENNLFLITGIICCITSAVILCEKNINNFLTISSFLFITSFLVSNFSGNTEMLMLPFISSYLYFFNSNKSYKFFIIGGLASILFNINYLASVIMMPVTIYMFFSSGMEKSIKNISNFILGFLLFSFFIFLPFFLSNQNIFDYFNLQIQFLSSYSNSNRLESLFFFLKYIFLFSPIFLLYIFLSKKDSDFYLIIFIFLGTLLGSISSGHKFSHYFEPSVIPLSLMFLKLMKIKIPLALISILPIIVITINIGYKRFKVGFDDKYLISEKGEADISHLNKLASIDKTTLNINSSHIIYLFSKARNINKYIFPGHVNLIYGSNSDNYFLKQIDKSPHLIMTKIGMCEKRNIICDAINKKYIYDSTSNFSYGYDLYVRKKSKSH